MSVRVKFRTSRAGLNAVARSEGIYRELERRANNVIREAQATAPRDTGEYARSFERSRMAGRTAGVRITATAPHSLIVEVGSRPHVIEARNGRALSWPGAAHPVRRVNHPGTPAFHTLRNALRAAGR